MIFKDGAVRPIAGGSDNESSTGRDTDTAPHTPSSERPGFAGAPPGQASQT
jgi:hypothetical protein